MITESALLNMSEIFVVSVEIEWVKINNCAERKSPKDNEPPPTAVEKDII